MKTVTKIILISALLFAFIYGVTTVKYKVDSTTCVACNACVSVCPTEAITMVDSKAVIDPEKCIGCGACAPVCPTKAIYPDSSGIDIDSSIMDSSLGVK